MLMDGFVMPQSHLAGRTIRGYRNTICFASCKGLFKDLNKYLHGMLPGHHAPALIRCHLFHGALAPAVGIPTAGADTRPHQICLVLPLHYWLKPKCSQDTALNNSLGHTRKDFGEVQ